MKTPAGGVPPQFNFATDVFDYWADTTPDQCALWCVCGKTGNSHQYSFRELSRISRCAAGFFRASGIQRGDRVLVMLPRVPDWWVCLLGLIRLGAVPVPATLQLTKRDVEYRVEAAKISAVITCEEGVAKADGFDGVRILAGGNQPGWLDLARALQEGADDFSTEKSGSHDPGLIYFTSATTGEPKMVLHTQVSYGLAHRVTGALWLDLKPGDTHWNLSDLGWAKAAWSSFFGPWHCGACVFALDARGKFDPASTLDVLEQHPITTWCAPPTALRLIVKQNLARRHFPKLRHCVTAGEPLNPEVLSLWKDATGLVLHEGYGQSETVILVGNFRSLGLPVVPGSMGQATPGYHVTLVDEDLREVPAGKEGEVAVKISPERPLGLFQEYWLNPAETARQFTRDWYLTGDRATREKDGYFWFIGRKDDVIKSSGYRIGPFEVESALLEHPAVMDVAVVGKPDPLRGQIVKAFVVLRPGETCTDRDLTAELQTHCKSLVAAYKYPREIEFVSELPKTTSGKTRRVELRRSAHS
jgi:acetyl-CoA synthetase/medium-chain acyl-CoA synthetase